MDFPTAALQHYPEDERGTPDSAIDGTRGHVQVPARFGRSSRLVMSGTAWGVPGVPRAVAVAGRRLEDSNAVTLTTPPIIAENIGKNAVVSSSSGTAGKEERRYR